MKKIQSGEPALMTACVLWGIGTVALSAANQYVGPLTVQGIRCLLSGLFLLPVIALLDKTGHSRKPANKEERRYLFCGGLLCGLLFLAICVLQQFALLYTTAGKLSFLVSFDVAMVPIFGIFAGKKVSKRVWLCALLALSGMCLMSFTADLRIGPGELMAMSCAVASALQILLIGKISPKVDGVRLSCIQFWVGCVGCMAAALLLETIQLETVLQAWLPIVYAGVFSSGIGFTLQVVGQARTEPVKAVVIMTMSAVFSALFGWLLLRQVMTLRELVGGIVILIGVILVQIVDQRDTHQAEKGETQ